MNAVGSERARRRNARRVDRAAHEEHLLATGPRAHARSPRRRSHPRSIGSWPSCKTQRAAGHERCRHVGAAARRRVLPLGAEGVHDDDHVAGRDPRAGSPRAGAPACADGRHPEDDRLFAGHGRRADDRRWRRIRAISSPRATRAAPRSWRSSRIASTGSRRRCRARSTRVVNPNMEVKRLPPEEEPGAPGAYGGAGSIDGSIPGRYWINLQDHETSTASTASPT